MSIDISKVNPVMDNPHNLRWLGCLEEHELTNLQLIHLSSHISVDKHGGYWFWDETQSNCFGPYPVREEAEAGLAEYGRSLDYKH